MHLAVVTTDTEQVDLEALISECASGSRAAQTKLYNQYSNRVFRILQSVLGNHPDVEDLVQLAWLDIFKGISSFEGRAKLETWLYRVVVNTAYRHLAKKKRLRQVIESFRRHKSFELEVTSTPFEKIQSRQELNVVYQILDELKPKKRIVFTLFELEGKTGEEIAEIIGCSENTVWTRLHHARKEIAEKFEKRRKR